MQLSKKFHVGAILSMVVFGLSLFIMKRVNLRAIQLSENRMDVSLDYKHWIYATICTLVFVIFYILISREFPEHEEEEEEEG